MAHHPTETMEQAGQHHLVGFGFNHWCWPYSFLHYFLAYAKVSDHQLSFLSAYACTHNTISIRNQQLGSELRRLSSERHTSRLRLWGKMKNY